MKNNIIAGIVLAAGESKRMDYPKMILPWANTTVIGQIIIILKKSDLNDILVVTGGWRDEVEGALSGFQVRTIYNPNFKEGGMLSSVQAGIEALDSEYDAALITLGDQPFIKLRVVTSILNTYRTSNSVLIVPSYEMRRGHPWLVDRILWGEILELGKDYTLRDFLNMKQGLINYVPVNTNSILLDLDTPEDYQNNLSLNKFG
jgi:molybdenum cofactor cytidylyltransferase